MLRVVLGGIFGKTTQNTFIEKCYNSGSIFANSGAGGIVGSMSGSILNCYNTATISSNETVGGIVGSTSWVEDCIIKYCYNIGNIEGKGTKNKKGSIIGNLENGNVQNCFYLNTSDIKAIENTDDEENNVYGLSFEYMQSQEFVDELNNESEEIVWKNDLEKNYKFPIFISQTSYPKYDEKPEEIILTEIKITTCPSKITYIEGENFDTTGMIVLALYNDGAIKEVKNYTITDGINLTAGQTTVTISYTENNITKTIIQNILVIENLKIDLGKYEEKQEETNKYLKNIAPETTIQEVLENINTNATIEIYKDTEKINDTETTICTGMKINFMFNDKQVEYIIIVTGDSNGDGESDFKDMLKINKHRLNKSSLIGEYLEAADVNGDGQADFKDMSKINKFRLRKINEL